MHAVCPTSELKAIPNNMNARTRFSVMVSAYQSVITAEQKAGPPDQGQLARAA
jgi:hypothetical protein